MRKTLIAAIVALAATGSTTALAAEGGAEIHRQHWHFSGIGGQFDKAQLQRGFQVYKEVCAACHSLKRIAIRNLAEPGGPGFPEAGVKALAASYEVADGPNEEGQMFKRPGLPSDKFPPIFANDNEARAANNGALPPDLSIIAKARGVEYHGPWYLHPLSMLKDIFVGYQEGGADYTHALLTGYTTPPEGFALAEGMQYNAAFPGRQIAMANPFAGGDGQVAYSDGTPATVDNYARDVAAFLYWAADPTHDQRKRTGWITIVYLLLTTVLLFVAKKVIWSRIPH